MVSLRRKMGVGFLVCVFFVGAGLGGEAPVRVGEIWGTVVDGVGDCSVERCAELGRCTSDEEAERVLGEMFGGRPAAGVVVTATNGRVTRKVVSDSQGKFTFAKLPIGPYAVSAMTPVPAVGQGGKRKVSVSKGTECGKTIRLVLHEELITVSGRIIDSRGRPIAGARVTGTAVPMREVGLPESRSAVSNAKGFYALKGFEPLNLYRVAGYLNGGRLEAPGAFHTQVEIQVKAKGFRQDKASLPRVPLVAEAQIAPARRLWKALSQFAATVGDGEDWQEMKDRPLPASKGSTITDVDIVLDD